MIAVKRKTEVVIILIIIAVCVGLIGLMKLTRGHAGTTLVSVTHDGEEVMAFDPAVDAVYDVEGDYGGLQIEVKDGSWRVINEQCPNHICAQMGWKNADSIDFITCVPNGIVIYVKQTDQ